MLRVTSRLRGSPGGHLVKGLGPEGAALVRRPGLGSASCMRSWGLGGPLASVWKVGGSLFPGLGTFPAVLTGPPSSASVGHYSRDTLTPCPWGSHPPARHPQVSAQMWVPPRPLPQARTAGATASLATLG